MTTYHVSTYVFEGDRMICEAFLVYDEFNIEMLPEHLRSVCKVYEVEAEDGRSAIREAIRRRLETDDDVGDLESGRNGA